MPSRAQKQRQHEDYWGACWAVALGRHMAANIYATPPKTDPPDVDFHIQKQDCERPISWGEITGSYYDQHEAKLMWSSEDEVFKHDYVKPTETIAAKARSIFLCKTGKYSELRQKRGKGHLMVILNSPLTTRSERIAAEDAIIGQLKDRSESLDFPFCTIWIGYRIPDFSDDEMEDDEYVYPDIHEKHKNFMKCIWDRNESP